MARTKTTKTTLDLRLPPAALYREDLEQIVERASQLPGSVSIETEMHELDSIADLVATYPDSIESLTITAGKVNDPVRISIYLHKDAPNSIFATGLENPQIRGVTEQIADIIKSRRPFAHQLASAWVFLPASAAYVVLSSTVSYGEQPVLRAGALIIYALIGVNFIANSFSNRITRRIGLFPYYRADRTPNFFQRKKDDLLVNLIVGVALFVLGYVVGSA